MSRRQDRQDRQTNAPGARTQDGAGDSTRGRQARRQGKQAHAEGEHGPKTRARIAEQLRSGAHREPVVARIERARHDAAYEGKRRLVEDRQQHDEAEKNSERTRLFVLHERGQDDGPSDNRGSLHGVLGHREHRADYKLRGPDGLRVKE
jgi:hypothetical protein